jgi:anaerobic selenocysteine-containing dehydrogenase
MHSTPKKLAASAAGLLPLLIQRTGPLTQRLALNPSGHSSQLIPTRMAGDRVVGSVCGYCSTGCNLSIHLRGQQALGLTPAPGYPVNLGMACPKGWEALAVLDAPERNDAAAANRLRLPGACPLGRRAHHVRRPHEVDSAAVRPALDCFS